MQYTRHRDVYSGRIPLCGPSETRRTLRLLTQPASEKRERGWVLGAVRSRLTPSMDLQWLIPSAFCCDERAPSQRTGPTRISVTPRDNSVFPRSGRRLSELTGKPAVVDEGLKERKNLWSARPRRVLPSHKPLCSERRGRYCACHTTARARRLSANSVPLSQRFVGVPDPSDCC